MNKELQFLIYSTPQEDVKIDVVVQDETVWLTQKAMSALFDVQVPAISKHIKNIYEEGELPENATISKMETVVNRGFRGEVIEGVDFYIFAECCIDYDRNSPVTNDFYAMVQNKHKPSFLISTKNSKN